MSYYASISKSSFFVPTENTGRVLGKLRHRPYYFSLDEEGNITGIEGRTMPRYTDIDLLREVAPYVRDQSFILVRGEEQDTWKWIFENGTCQVISPKIVWEG